MRGKSLWYLFPHFSDISKEDPASIGGQILPGKNWMAIVKEKEPN